VGNSLQSSQWEHPLHSRGGSKVLSAEEPDPSAEVGSNTPTVTKVSA
jgi:hypothetical protein